MPIPSTLSIGLRDQEFAAGGKVMANRMMRWFVSDHLPSDLQPISRYCGNLAKEMDERLPEGAEKTAGLRKLLEAKDCFVRAKLEGEDPICTVSGLLKNICLCQHCKLVSTRPVSASGCSHIPGECAHTADEVARGA